MRLQQPNWKNIETLNQVKEELKTLPALVYAQETRDLKRKIADAGEGKSILIQAGECSEEFQNCNGKYIHDILRLIYQMSLVISYGTSLPVIKIGRIGGQYGKPRSNSTELVDGCEIPVYRGDMVNSHLPIMEMREADPERLLQGYFRSCSTLNLVRAFATGGYGKLENNYDWFLKNQSNDKNSFELYNDIIKQIAKSIKFLDSYVSDVSDKYKDTFIYASHEALLLDYEECFIREDSLTHKKYLTSAHFHWIGDRTRHADSEHVKLLAIVENPVGIKIGHNVDLDELICVINTLNPSNEKGRITLICRLGVKEIKTILPKIIRKINDNSLNVTWICDPMHGNTELHGSTKTRNFDNIIEEIQQFIKINKKFSNIPAGLHLEMTGQDVTECYGGSSGCKPEDLSNNYLTKCDPRLNASQALQLSFELAKSYTNEF